METGYVQESVVAGKQNEYISQTKSAENQKQTGKVSGKTIGNPTLSDTAAKYYEQLKKKYSNLDFVLVSKDQKESAQASVASYANANRMVVLIDEEKIEKMATDEAYREKYEGIISGATMQLAQIATGLGSNASNVKGYGMTVNDGGTASFFAVVDKSLQVQRERIEENAKEKRAQKKEEAKKEAEEKMMERWKESDDIIVTASSAEELLQRIDDVIYAGMSDRVMTQEEMMLGGRIDFSA